MDITIRQATKQDADIVPELMLQAMEDIVFNYIDKQDIEQAITFLTHFFQQPDNLYSYQNTFVALDQEQEIVGCITGYNGDEYESLRQPVLQYIKQNYNESFIGEQETTPEQFYIDTLAVSASTQGQGIGTKLLEFLIQHAKEQGHKKVGLLVDIENVDALKLYKKLGFSKGEIIEFAQGEYYSMHI